MKNRRILIFVLIGIVLIAVTLSETISFLPHPATVTATHTPGFDGTRAYTDVLAQTAFGPRTPGSQAHADTVAYISTELKKAGWIPTLQKQEINGHIAENIVAKRNEATPTILLGAHYDSRLWADNDNDPANRRQPVPGANDGASGVAVLLEIARTLPRDSASVWLVFFDIEDNGSIPGWDWILGSKAYAGSLTVKPKVVVVVDMIGDANLNINMEHNSDAEYTRQIWGAAKRLGYESAFLPEYKYTVEDDHLPFIEKGLRAVDIIDLDYPYWHTVQDTADKVSAKSLQIVGATLLEWIKGFEK